MKTKRFLLRASSLLLATASSWAGTGKAPVGKDKTPIPVPPAAKSPSRSHFRLSAGVSYRTLGDAGFHTGSYSSGARLPFFATIPQYHSDAVGSANRYADRRYRDGFVFRDSGTAANGDTWNWGYDSAGQVFPGTLSYHAFGGATTQSGGSESYDGNQSWADEITGAAPVVTLDWLYDVKPDLSVGLSLGWMFLGTDGSHSTSNFSASQSASAHGLAITDHYDLQGVIAPAAPYAGSFNGPGPVITNQPTSRSVTGSGQLAASSAAFINAITESFEIDLHTISLGPTVEKRWGRLSANFGGGLALNVVTYDAEFQETLYGNGRAIQQWHAQENATEVLLGAYIQAGVNYQISQRWSIAAFARYDWSEDFTTTVGPSTFHFDPSGWSVGAKVGFAF